MGHHPSNLRPRCKVQMRIGLYDVRASSGRRPTRNQTHRKPIQKMVTGYQCCKAWCFESTPLSIKSLPALFAMWSNGTRIVAAASAATTSTKNPVLSTKDDKAAISSLTLQKCTSGPAAKETDVSKSDDLKTRVASYRRHSHDSNTSGSVASWDSLYTERSALVDWDEQKQQQLLTSTHPTSRPEFYESNSWSIHLVTGYRNNDTTANTKATAVFRLARNSETNSGLYLASDEILNALDLVCGAYPAATFYVSTSSASNDHDDTIDSSNVLHLKDHAQVRTWVKQLLAQSRLVHSVSARLLELSFHDSISSTLSSINMGHDDDSDNDVKATVQLPRRFHEMVNAMSHRRHTLKQQRHRSTMSLPDVLERQDNTGSDCNILRRRLLWMQTSLPNLCIVAPELSSSSSSLSLSWNDLSLSPTTQASMATRMRSSTFLSFSFNDANAMSSDTFSMSSLGSCFHDDCPSQQLGAFASLVPSKKNEVVEVDI
jgi:hypothetical protein